ncbi:sulfatase family protein [Gaetbulibacter saemankumensis]|uniref:sulfatase family protein n=1 Tax=Gaetbulibacter saemankumensis TaxID=311208 RepID=UPI000687AB24|nr:sulfatase [Gaetbulibacter saemankumensis]
MNFRNKNILIALSLLGFNALLFNGCKPTSKSIAKTKESLPNILLFLGDDMTWRDCAPYGNKDVITPNIQKLADEGVCFDNMFTSTAMCAPSRQQLMTGLYPARSGAFPNHSVVYDGVKSFAHHFKDLGYRVALIGKQHYGPDDSFPIEYLGGRQHDNGKNGSDIHLEKIEPIVTGDQPFFLIIAQNQPHIPWNRGDKSQYNAETLKLPEYVLDTPKTRDEFTKYYAEITYMDSLLGKTLSYIKEAGKEEKTISLFTSEQGYTFPFAKWTCYDMGLKTGFIAKWPGTIKAGTRNSATAQYVDIIPTLLEAVGADPKNIDTGIADANGYKGFDGFSFLSALLGETQTHRKYTFGIQTTRGIYEGSEAYPVRSVRSNKYLYIRNLNAEANFYNTVTVRSKIYKAWLTNAESTDKEQWVKRYQKRPFEELYDIENDPFALNDIADSVGVKKIKDVLSKELDNWMAQQGDKGIATEMEALSRRQHKAQEWISHDKKIKKKSINNK